ncbi:MAG: hypothetical protein ACJAVV_002621 [Alphaproteobacteria bacterium]|jgi:hypothetical protein
MTLAVINKRILLAFFVSISLLWHAPSLAHDIKQGYIFLTISDDSISGRVEINIVDLNQALGLDIPAEKNAFREDVLPHLDVIKAYFNERMNINLNEGLRIDDFSLHTIPKVQFVAFPFSIDNLPDVPEYIDIEYTALFDVNTEHRGFIIIENDWRTGTFNDEGNIAFIFSPDDTKHRLDLTQSTTTQGYVEMFKLGVHHIWDGIDHILFLFALLLPSVLTRYKENKWHAKEKFFPAFMYVVKIVSIFTLAHTITLSAATLGFVSLSSRLVESIIALSIAVAALDLLTPIFRGRLWMIVFAFGLFHGFGFASVLSDYPIPDSYLTLSLLAFNLGVEAGQIAIVAAVVPVLFLLRNQFFYIPIILKLGAVVLIVVSMYWFIERGFEIDLPAGEYWNMFKALFA